ncbi:MAG: carbon-nitrogen hydrolase family protein [Rubrivivax sp.]
MVSVNSNADSKAATLRVALVQNCATPDAAATVEGLRGQIRSAAAQGAQLIALPEACEFLHPDNEVFQRHARPVPAHPAAAALAQEAKAAQAWLLVGSLSVRADNGRLANRSMLISPRGEVHASYDKIHLFDAAPGEKESLESRIYERGARARVVDIGPVRLGLSICYDLRFPHLYRALAQAGAQILAVPSAFMQVTGAAHWHVLLRARAIETGCFVIAPAQCGVPHAGRESYGHSLVVGPWGEVLVDAGTEPAVVVADLDLAEIAKARRQIPSIHQQYAFQVEAS